MVTINIAGGALAVNGIATPSTICAGMTTQLQAIGSGGAGNYTYQWTGPGGFTSNLQNPTVQPLVTSTYTVLINDGYNSQSNTVTVNVNQLPVADAGANKSIPYGTYTFLSGSVQGGTSNYFYSWTPADKLVNSNVQSPQTLNLTATTLYSLVVTDLITNCISSNQANVSVEVTGGALNANPVATPEWICRGDTTQLHASAGGGNVGFYEYTWTSNPPGFSSTTPDPFVHPTENTSFTVSVFDGFNTTTGSTAVSIYAEPFIHLGPADSTVCIYDTVRLDAGNPGAEYLWSNGSVTQTINVQATGIVPETQTYTVKVTNEHGCFSQSAIDVSFSFNACVGINEQYELTRVRIYPNPSKGLFTLISSGQREDIQVSVASVHGKKIKSFILKKNESGPTTETLDLTNYPKGVYLIRFGTNSQLWTEKLVIE
jgi:hypothetical protein